MAGVKGRSGRRSRKQEVDRGNLEQVCSSYLLDNFEDFSPAIKLKIALNIASKMVTQKSEVSSTVNITDQLHKLADHIDSNRLYTSN